MRITVAFAAIILPLTVASLAAAEPPAEKSTGQNPLGAEQRQSKEDEYFVIQDSRSAKCHIANERRPDERSVVIGNGYKTYQEAWQALKAISLCRSD